MLLKMIKYVILTLLLIIIRYGAIIDMIHPVPPPSNDHNNIITSENEEIKSNLITTIEIDINNLSEIETNQDIKKNHDSLNQTYNINRVRLIIQNFIFLRYKILFFTFFKN